MENEKNCSLRKKIPAEYKPTFQTKDRTDSKVSFCFHVCCASQ